MGTQSLIYAGLNRDQSTEIIEMPHQMEVATFTAPTHCDECHMLLLGIFRQGYMCQLCSRITCASCLDRLSNDCQPNSESAARNKNRVEITGPFASCCQTPNVVKYVNELEGDLE